MAEITMHFSFILRGFSSRQQISLFFCFFFFFLTSGCHSAFQVGYPQPQATVCLVSLCLFSSRRPPLVTPSWFSTLPCHHPFKAGKTLLWVDGLALGMTQLCRYASDFPLGPLQASQLALLPQVCLSSS